MNNKLKTSIFAGVVAVGALGLSGAATAQVRLGINLGVPAPAPVYVAPQPVYAPPPPPVVYAPPPPPVVYAPAPVYAQPAIVIGWHGDRYYDGRRYWARDDWYRHHGGGPRYGDHRGWH
ncbi:hypothetical protein [Caballeronia sp. dw_276]|jgi:hypothetical protein|uniref:hypothetical protein n=1 Tax=Caballeronia sp. dw_276 TaxID=2719795 RepID=UPI001BD2CF4D|nr:hypothetical protein [Caballeronia sp. dw_276]